MECVSVPGVAAVAGEEEDAGKRNRYLLNEDSINFWAMWSYTEKLLSSRILGRELGLQSALLSPISKQK